ncbi:transposase, partial [Frankia sp. Cpl3]|nr:transposase [Frankia sp. Cpl3]
MVTVLDDGTFLTVLIDPKIKGARRDRVLDVARAGEPLHPEEARLVRVVEYDVPDRDGDGAGELIVLLSTLLDPTEASAGDLAGAYHQRWEHETANDQLKTHLRGPGRPLRSRLPDLAYQEIWAFLLVHHALAVLITHAADAAEVDPDRVGFTRTLRLVRRSATGTADFS